jgi:hypothetical protein
MTTIERNRAHARRWRHRNPEKVALGLRKAALKRYGLTLLDVELMKLLQGGRCECCRKAFVKTPNVDHNHNTGEVRALLCSNCNAGLGLFEDSIPLLLRAVAYLSAFDHNGQIATVSENHSRVAEKL